MSGNADGKELTRERLCALVGIDRARHRRWIRDDLLPPRDRYGETDLIAAAALGALSDVLKPALAREVWSQVRSDLELPTGELDVVVTPSIARARLVRSRDELLAALPRNEPVLVVALTDPVARARERLREYRSHRRDERAAPRGALARLARKQGEDASGNA